MATHIVVDIEADGPIPGDYSMIALGAVKLHSRETFLGLLKPISDQWVPEALAVSGYPREDTLYFPDAETTMKSFQSWLLEFEHPYIFWADNNGFDWQFVNWYFHHFLGDNPFGFSSRNINDVFHGLKADMRASFKGMRKTKHDHNPVNDAMGNAEALEEMIEKYELKGSWRR